MNDNNDILDLMENMLEYDDRVDYPQGNDPIDDYMNGVDI